VGNSPTNATDPSGLIDPRVITPEELKELKEILPPLSGETEEDYLKSLNVRVRRKPDDFVEEFDYFPFGMHGSIHLTDDYFLRRNLPVPTMVCHGMSAMGRVGPVNSFRFEHPARMQEYIETQYVFANIALLFVPLPIGKAPIGGLQGINAGKLAEITPILRNGMKHLGDDVVFQGSRVAGTARATSDLDIAVRVGPDEFADLIRKRFRTPNPGSAKERTRLHAIETGKIQAGEAGLSGLRKQLQRMLGMDVDLSVIKRGGPFDNGPTLPLGGN
jgi:predicted nucleotidyltransferase